MTEAEIQTVTEMAHAYQYERDEAIKRAERLRALVVEHREKWCDVWQDFAGGPTAREFALDRVHECDAAIAADDAVRGEV